MTRLNPFYAVMWRVQVRKSRAHKWKNKGLFETRNDARFSAKVYRDVEPCGEKEGYGFGNSRVVRHISGKGRSS